MAPFNQKIHQPLARAVPLRWLSRGAQAPAPLDAQGFRLVKAEQIGKVAAATEEALGKMGPELDEDERQSLGSNPGGIGVIALCNRGFAVAGLLGLFPELAQRCGLRPEALTELCFQRVGYLGAEDTLTHLLSAYEGAPLLLGGYAGLIHQAAMAHLDGLLRGKDEAEQARVLAPFRPVLGLAAQELDADEQRKGAVQRERDERREQVSEATGQAVYDRVIASLRAGAEVPEEDLAAAEAFMDAREAERRADLLKKAPPAAAKPSRARSGSDRRGGGR